MPAISNVDAHKILDSNGEWTIQAVVTLADGTRALAAVPSGHSVGKHEAKLVTPEQAIENITTLISPHIKEMEVSAQDDIDRKLLEMDRTTDKAKLGANTILAVSLACFKAAAAHQKVELFQYINEVYQFTKPTLEEFPTPLINLINGGAHASNNLEFQSFMVSPATFMPYSKSLELGTKVYHKLKEILIYKNLKIDVGEEGGFAPSGLDTDQACHFIVESILESGIKPGTEMFLAIDVASNGFFNSPNYQTRGVLGAISPDQLREVYVNLVRNFPILYLEDPFAEDAWEDWTALKAQIGNSVEIVGDDLTVTNPQRLTTAIKKSCITGIIIKTNQIGTLTETIDVVRKAQQNNLTVVISHRSGETAEDSFIADLAVGVGANYIKAGAPARGERTVKYNRLLEIESLLLQNNPIHVAVNLETNQKGIIMENPITTPLEPTIPNPIGSSLQPTPTQPNPEAIPQPTLPPTPQMEPQPNLPEQGEIQTPITIIPATESPIIPTEVPEQTNTTAPTSAPLNPVMPTNADSLDAIISPTTPPVNPVTTTPINTTTPLTTPDVVVTPVPQPPEVPLGTELPQPNNVVTSDVSPTNLPPA